MPKIVFIDQDGAHTTVDAKVGALLMEVAIENGVDIEAACGGALACATCHMIVDPAWFATLPAANAEELDMLDLASGLTPTSRLTCQLTVTAAMDGLILRLPPVS